MFRAGFRDRNTEWLPESGSLPCYFIRIGWLRQGVT